MAKFSIKFIIIIIIIIISIIIIIIIIIILIIYSPSPPHSRFKEISGFILYSFLLKRSRRTKSSNTKSFNHVQFVFSFS